MQKVGPKGQVVIPKEIRDALGVEPGWIVLPLLVEDHVELHFFAPPHSRSLKGMLAGEIQRTISAEEWHAAREEAWAEAVRERYGTSELTERTAQSK